MKNIVVLSLALLMGIAGCRKKEDPKKADPPKGKSTSLAFTFKNVAGNELLSLNDTWYKNENGDSLKISSYKYYVTNFVLIKGDSQYVVPESYYLIDESEPDSKIFIFKDIPAGNYDKVKFLIGVDGMRNTSGAQTGALDPVHGMFWDWNTGYIMAKMEGESPQVPGSAHKFSYHAGGFKFGSGAQREVMLKLPNAATVSPSYYPNIIIRSDVLEWFKTPNVVSIADLSVVSNNVNDVTILADNYADMFTVEDVVIAVE